MSFSSELRVETLRASLQIADLLTFLVRKSVKITHESTAEAEKR